MLAVKPCSACATAKRAPGFGDTSFASSLQWTPLNVVSNRLQRVTQWMSTVISRLGKLDQLLPRERQRALDLPVDREAPRREVGVRNGAGVQDRPLLGQVLAGREPRRVVPGLRDLFLFFRPEERHRFLD